MSANRCSHRDCSNRARKTIVHNDGSSHACCSGHQCKRAVRKESK